MVHRLWKKFGGPQRYQEIRNGHWIEKKLTEVEKFRVKTNYYLFKAIFLYISIKAIFLSYSEHWFLFSFPDNTPIISGRTWCGICFRLSKQYDEESDVINKNSLRQMVIGLHSKSGRYDIRYIIYGISYTVYHIPHLEYSVLNITFYNDSGQVILLQINKYSTKKLTLLFWRWNLWLDEILEDLKSSCFFQFLNVAPPGVQHQFDWPNSI